jgi:hypothetical protein
MLINIGTRFHMREYIIALADKELDRHCLLVSSRGVVQSQERPEATDKLAFVSRTYYISPQL